MIDDLQLCEQEGRVDTESRLAVTETPTFFGPSESPLFGVVHAPSDGRVRGGVLLCGSHGKDQADSIRGLRVLADQLAGRGILAMRFDYLGCGDSSYDQLRDNAVQEWQDSIHHALTYLRSAGVTDVSAVGLRAGCLILDQTLSGTDSFDRVAYWDPASSGRRYLREQTAFFKMGAGEDEVPAGVVSTIGARFSARAAADFNALRLRDFPETIARLIVGRTSGADAQLKSLAGDGRTETVLIDGLENCAQPTRMLTQTSWEAIDIVAEWFDKELPLERTPAKPVFCDATWVADGDGTFAFERIERIAPHGLFVIRSLPTDDGDLAVERPTVVFFTNGPGPHYGPSREWVELSRQIAAAGGAALRWDRRVVGESERARDDEEIRIYSPDGIEDALAATRHARIGASRVQLVGVCSGAWLASLAATELGVESVVLANQLQWSRRVKKSLRTAAQPGDADAINWEQTPRARTRRALQRYLPASAWSTLGQTGLVQAPHLTLGPLATRGRPTTVILCTGDLELFRANRGDVSLRRLRRSACPPRLIISTGDHAGFHQGLFPPLRSTVLNFVKD